jgi:hypothetical protein
MRKTAQGFFKIEEENVEISPLRFETSLSATDPRSLEGIVKKVAPSHSVPRYIGLQTSLLLCTSGRWQFYHN